MKHEAPKKWKYAYGIISVKTGRLILIQGTLPIYWGREIAEERASNFSNVIVKKIKLESLNEGFK